jgi:hypothetical protein
LPKRSGRNDDPIGKRAKAAKAAEAKAAKEAKAADKRRQAVEAEAAKERLAEMEIEESFVQAQEDKWRVRQRSDIEALNTGGDKDDSEDEFAELSNMVSSCDSEESSAEGASSIDDEPEHSEKRHGPKVCLDVHNMQ